MYGLICRIHDMHVVIAGGGFAGLSAALYARLYGFDATIIEELAPGGRCLDTRHARFVPGLPVDAPASEVAERLETQVRDMGVVFMSDRVTHVHSDPGEPDTRVRIVCEQETLHADACIVAVGDARRTAGIPGEEALRGRGVSYCATCDGPLFRGRDVCVIGGGDSACDEALFLSDICQTVHVLCRSRDLTAMPALREEVQSRQNIRLHFNTEVSSFSGVENSMGFQTMESVHIRSGSEEHTIAAAAAFVFVGRQGISAGIADTCESDTDGRLITDARMRTSIERIYAIGSARSNPVPQFVVGAADGAIAVRDLYDRYTADA